MIRLFPRALAAATLAVVALSASTLGDERGARPEALEPCDQAFDRGLRAEARACYSGLSTSSSDAVRAEAWWALGDVKRANDVFRAAVQAQPDNPDLRVRWGYLYEQTHQEPEALNLFNEALGIDKEHLPAKLGIASVLAGRFEDKAKKLVDEAIEAKPEQVLGYLIRARLQMQDKELDAADETLDMALEKAESLGRSPLEVYTLKASVDLLRGITDSKWTQTALERNPTYGRVYADAAHFYVITRRYREAVELLEKAVEIDPELWSAHADLGVNLLRENRDAEGRRHLEIAYEGDPFSAKTVNTLRLVDSFENFDVYSNHDLMPDSIEEAAASLDKPEVIARLHKKEGAMLRPYVMALSEEAVAKFSEKYKFTPDRPIYVELYPDHDDFAVRTMGMPGVGLLGVTFGYLVAMDSPSGRSPGSFHWGTTLWHELAHVFTLEATDHLVPRWYSEGISMYEEWEARPNWGERINPDFIKAYHEGKLLPIADLDKGFIRPSYPSQIAVSYFQAGLVCQMIHREWGPGKLVELLEAFAEDTTTAAAIEKVIGVPSKELDERFDAFLKAKLGPLAEEDGLDDWRKALKASLEAFKAENFDEALEKAEQAKRIYPDYVESGNPYALRAEIYEKKGAREAAVSELEAYFKRGGRNPDTLRKLAKWLGEAGRDEAAIAALDEVLYIFPGDESLHVELGELYQDEGKSRAALREFQAALAMDPHDKAAAHFRVAEAYHKMDDSDRTRRHLLLSLEAAPGYRPAQKLLLEIARKGSD